MGKRTAQKDTIKDITSDSEVNSYFPYRWSPASLAINICFYLFLYLYITRITINNGTPHLKSLMSQNRRAALGRPAIKLLGGRGGGSSTGQDCINYYLLILHFIKPRNFDIMDIYSMILVINSALGSCGFLLPRKHYTLSTRYPDCTMALQSFE